MATLRTRLDRLEGKRGEANEPGAIRATQAYVLAGLTRKHGGPGWRLNGDWRRRLTKLEAARSARPDPDPDADAAFAALAEVLDWLAGR